MARYRKLDGGDALRASLIDAMRIRIERIRGIPGRIGLESTVDNEPTVARLKESVEALQAGEPVVVEGRDLEAALVSTGDKRRFLLTRRDDFLVGPSGEFERRSE